MFWLVARIGEVRNALKVLFLKPEEKTSLARPKRRWDITMILKVTICEGAV
jgi:hypothetical protein